MNQNWAQKMQDRRTKSYLQKPYQKQIQKLNTQPIHQWARSNLNQILGKTSNQNLPSSNLWTLELMTWSLNSPLTEDLHRAERRVMEVELEDLKLQDPQPAHQQLLESAPAVLPPPKDLPKLAPMEAAHLSLELLTEMLEQQGTLPVIRDQRMTMEGQG